MSQNKRQKMDLGAACSSASANTQEMSTSVLEDGGEPHIAQQTARANHRAGSSSTNVHIVKEEDIFVPGLVDFREAVKWFGFVDRTMLMIELVESNKRGVIVFAPRRFGKTMNLDMVKCFFEIEKDRNVTEPPQNLEELEKFENFKAFMRYGIKQPCKILSKVEFVKEHFGRYPVVHLTFKNVRVYSIPDVQSSLRRLVRSAYDDHSYLKNGKIFPDSNDNENAIKECRLWCDPEAYKNQDPIEGLQRLIKYLHAYHDRKVYLLVDEFDAPTVKAMMRSKSEGEVKDISFEITELLGAVVKDEVAKKHLFRTLITGVSYLGSVGISDHLNNLTAYKWLFDDSGRFAPYYGLTHDELTTILEDVFPNQEQKQKRVAIQEEVKLLYNGYNFKDRSLYCLWSVLHYITNRLTMSAEEITTKTFWGSYSINKQMAALLKNNEIMEDIMDLMFKKCISFSRCDKVDVMLLTDFLKNGESSNDKNTVLSFFLEQGYLTRVFDQPKNVPDDNNKPICDDKPKRGNEISVKIPNEEVTDAFREMFEYFSFTICGLSTRRMLKCAEVFKNLPKVKNDALIEERLEGFYEHLVPLLQDFSKCVGVNEFSLQAALYNAMLKAGFKECCTEYRIEVDSKTGRIDLWMFDGYNIFIFELKVIDSDDDEELEKSARKAINEILLGSKTKKVPYVKVLPQYDNKANYVLIGMSMSRRGKVCMYCLINSEKFEDCIYFPKLG